MIMYNYKSTSGDVIMPGIATKLIFAPENRETVMNIFNRFSSAYDQKAADWALLHRLDPKQAEKIIESQKLGAIVKAQPVPWS